jgi:hypothetical protein
MQIKFYFSLFRSFLISGNSNSTSDVSKHVKRVLLMTIRTTFLFLLNYINDTLTLLPTSSNHLIFICISRPRNHSLTYREKNCRRGRLRPRQTIPRMLKYLHYNNSYYHYFHHSFYFFLTFFQTIQTCFNYLSTSISFSKLLKLNSINFCCPNTY